MYISKFNLFLAASLLMPCATVQANQALSLQQAEQIAIQRDAVTKSYQQKALAFNEQAKASDSWPDPRLKLGAQAVPVDSFDLQQEPMTQLVLGYQQMLPRGNSNEFAAQSKNAMSRMQIAKSHKREREVLMKVRQAWLDVVLYQKSVKIIQANRRLFEKMLDISESFYAAGRQQQQDVVQAELEISLVDDRLEQANSMLIVARENLARWVGDENIQNGVNIKPANLQLLPIPDIQLLSVALDGNPELITMREKIISQQTKLRLADEQYNPQWGFDINYGLRSGENSDGSDRADFLTAMVTFDLPLFTANNQDRKLSAERQRLQAVRYDQIDVKRMLSMQLKQVIGRLQKLQARHQLYAEKVLPQARQNTEVSLNGYQSGVVSFFTLTRASITELNTRLSDLQIDIAYNKAYAELQYLTGEKIMNSFGKFGGLVVIIVTALGVGWYVGQMPAGIATKTATEISSQQKAEPKKEKKLLYWVAPMDPAYRRDKAGKSPMGMDLVPVYEDGAGDSMGGDADEVGINITAAVVNNMGVRTAVVESGKLWRKINTVGYVGFDESRVSHIHLRVDGWIEKLAVSVEGERVKKGQRLFDVYSPQLVNAMEEYVQALRSTNHRLINASRQKLISLGVSEQQIIQLGKTKVIPQATSIYASQDGIVSMMKVRDGMYVKPSTEVMSLADLSSVWVLAEVFESQSEWVKLGQFADVELSFIPGRTWEGVVDYVYPSLDAKNRTLKVRLRFDNKDESLKPNMYTNVVIYGGAKKNVLNVPLEALIRSGGNERLIIARGAGRFVQRKVVAGIETGDRVEIISGVEAGEKVVTSAQFLIDSEANLKASLLRMDSGQVMSDDQQGVQ